MPATESKNGRFQFNPGSATRRNLPNRVITATSAVRTVKKLPKIRYSTKQTATPNGIQYSSFIWFPPLLPLVTSQIILACSSFEPGSSKAYTELYFDFQTDQ